MSIQITPRPEQISTLEHLAKLDREKLASAVAFIGSARPIPLTPGELLQAIARAKIADEDVERIAEQAVSLHGLMHSSGVEAGEIIAALRMAVADSDKSPQWWDDQFSSLLTRLISMPGVRAVSKAASLAYEHMHLFRSARLVTDVRPVFDDDVDDIDGAIISHNLRLEYFGRGGANSLSVTLDTPDLLQLFNQCERALRKANLTKQILMEGKPINATILGGDPEDQETDLPSPPNELMSDG